MHSSRFRAARAVALCAALAMAAAALADDIPWVFSGSTNRNASATASASSGTTLVVALDNGFVASANSITMSTCPPATILMFK